MGSFVSFVGYHAKHYYPGFGVDRIKTQNTRRCAMKNEYISKDAIINMLTKKRDDWESLKGKDQDMMHENFVCDIILSINWIIADINRMQIAE